MKTLTDKVGLDRVAMTMKARGIEHLLGAEAHRPGPDGLVEVVLPVVCRRRSGRTRVINGPNTVEADPEERNEVLEAIARGFCWMEEIEKEPGSTVTSLAHDINCDEAYVRRHVALAMIYPVITENNDIRERAYGHEA